MAKSTKPLAQGQECTTSKGTLLTMQVLEFSPIKESLSTCVSLLSRNGV